MPLIETHSLTKAFRLPHKDEGLGGAIRHLVRPRYVEKVAIEDLTGDPSRLT